MPAPFEAQRIDETSSRKAPQAPRPDAIARLLGHLFGTRRIGHLDLLSEGLSNFNYRVDLDPGVESIVLRIYGRDPSRCQKEADFLQSLRNKLPVPEVLHVDAGGCCGVGPFIITRYIEGISFRQLRRMGDSGAIAQAAYAIGKTLPAFSPYRSTDPAMLGTSPAIVGHFLNGPLAIPELIDSCLTSPTLRRRLDGRVRERIQAVAWSRARDLAGLQKETCLVHGDFSNRNVLVRRRRGRWVVAGVIDWELAVSGSPLYDIASFLQYERVRAPSREPHFSLGYRHGGGKLPEGWRQLARVVGLATQCEALTQTTLPAFVATEVAELVRETTAEESM